MKGTKEQDFKKRITKNTKGITLIALVVTIIVLLILAGVSIAMLTGNNGILTQGKRAKEEQAHAAVKEGIMLLYNEYRTKQEVNASKVQEETKVASTELVKIAENEGTEGATENLGTFKDFIQSKNIINSDGIINVRNLLGQTLSLGNGTSKESGDVYVFEEQDDYYNLTYYNKQIQQAKIYQIKNENAPLPFNLTKLQSHISKKYKIKPNETLKITQDLREKYHAITYNRSDSQYLNEEHYKEAPGVIKKVLNNIDLKLDLDYSNLPHSKCFDNSKVTAHHGIIPTSVDIYLSKMNDKEQKIYKEICMYYLIQFIRPIKKEITYLETDEQNGYKFKASSTKILDEGFNKYLDKTNNENQESVLSKISEGLYTGTINKSDIKEIETKPLARYTQASLIEDMTRISKYVDDPEIKEILKRKDKDKEGENGSIGTSATRASIIQNLIKRGYIKEEKDKVISTELGREYYNILPDEWKKADLTAKWWIIQEEIRDGKADQNKLLDSILIDIKNVLSTSDVSKFKLKKNYKNDKTVVGQCPNCGKNIIESAKSFYCSGFKEGCKFSVWKTIAGKKISKTNIKQLLENGVTTEIKGFKAKSGKQFNAKLQIINGEIKFLF